ncbi:MAG: hypothetical protein Phog2KO_12940 [Phototrophicaceae bacterium]
MTSSVWEISQQTGFLIQPQPLHSLIGHIHNAEKIELLANNLADLLETRQIRQELDALDILNLTHLDDEAVIERAFQIYAYLASAYVFATGENPAKHIPASIAIPLVTLAEKVERPPILAYAPYTLANWQKIDPNGAIEVDNLQLVQKFIYKHDASWFTLIHVDIEARASKAISAIPRLEQAIIQDDSEQVIQSLKAIYDSLADMMATLKRMPEHCHPSVYYHEVRPYIFSFEDIVYEGVEKFAGKPQSFVGETGAQSSIIPALVRVLGVSHQETTMTKYLRIMQDYMPKPHREFIQAINPSALRGTIQKMNQQAMINAYNETLQQLLVFRKMHIRYAASYIANQSSDSVGTGGTEFMTWLQKLIDETDAQLL